LVERYSVVFGLNHGVLALLCGVFRLMQDASFLVIACVVESVVHQHEDPYHTPKCAVFSGVSRHAGFGSCLLILEFGAASTFARELGEARRAWQIQRQKPLFHLEIRCHWLSYFLFDSWDLIIDLLLYTLMTVMLGVFIGSLQIKAIRSTRSFCSVLAPVGNYCTVEPE